MQVGRQSPIQLRLQNNVISLDDGDRSDHAALTFVGTQTTALHSRDLADRVITSYGLASSPASAAEITSVGFFLAPMIALIEGSRAVLIASETEITAGSGASITS